MNNSSFFNYISNETYLSNGTVQSEPGSIDTIRRICIGFWAIIVAFGLFGNCLTIAVLVSPKLNNSSTTFYLTVLAFIDILYLIFSLGGQMFNFSFLFPNSIRQINPVACISLNIICFSLTYISVWLLVAVAIDRMIWVIFPFRAKLICTRNISKIIVIVLCATFILIDIHFIWTLDFEYKMYELNNCNIKHKVQKWFPFVDLTLVMGLPFIVMSCANSLIISKLRQMEKIRKGMKSASRSPNATTLKNTKFPSKCSNRQHDRNQTDDEIAPCEITKRSTRRRSRDKQTTSLTKMLLSVNIFFLVSTAPLLLYNILFNIEHTRYIMLSFERQIAGLIFGLERVFYTLWYLNFAVHFLLYCMSGPKFRQEAIRLLYNFCCFCRCILLKRLINIESRTTNNINDSQYMKTYCLTEENKYVKDCITIPNQNVCKTPLSGEQQQLITVELLQETNM